MDRWTEVRTAYTVVRLGTVSAAADALGVHRATVIRHIDALEASLGARLFQRHARGYTPTDAGRDLERVARTTHEQFEQLAVRARDREVAVSGEVIVTSVELISPLVTRALAVFRTAHPDVTVRYIASGRVLQLAYGEAHVAVRAGRRPDHPDNVVRPFLGLSSTLYAQSRYIERFGLPECLDDFSSHAFVLHEDPGRRPAFSWLESVVPQRCLVLRSASHQVLAEGVRAGMGIGFMPIALAAGRPDLHPVMQPRADWTVPLWLVTHVDLHRTAKVRAVSEALLEQARAVQALGIGGAVPQLA
jgi:DNA-binding transcriptional LysR family regulator